MPDHQGIYDRVAAALAARAEPDLSAFDPAEVQVAMQGVLGSEPAREEFLAWLGPRVRQLSGGDVTVDELPPQQEPPAHDQQSEGPELGLRIAVRGEPFAEPAVLRPDAPVVHFPMRP